MGHRNRPLDRRGNSLVPGIKTTPEKTRLDNVWQVALFENNFLGIHAGEWRVVLVHALYRDTVDGRPGRIGQGRSPLEMGRIEDPRPVHGTHDDRPPGTKHDITDGLQRVVDTNNRLDPATAQRMVHRRRDIKPKRGQLQVAGLPGSSRPAWQKGPGQDGTCRRADEIATIGISVHVFSFSSEEW